MEDEEEDEEMPGMSMKVQKVKEAPVEPIGLKEKKAIARMAVKALHSSKAFKTKEAQKAKKQRNASRWKKSKKLGKRAAHAKKFSNAKDTGGKKK